MRKYIYLIIAIIAMAVVYLNVNASSVVIPDSAIRVRVIANSNNLNDINMKLRVTEYLESVLSPLLIDVNDIDDARNIIYSNIDSIDNGIGVLFKESGYDVGYSVKYGDNYFPNKVYKGVKYNAGNYESLVVTIGEGSGDNWWCVLFPPLCLLEASDSDDVEYKIWVKELIDKYF